MTLAPRIVAVLKLPRHVPDVIKLAQQVTEAMTGNPAFPGATALLATVTASAAALVAAETAAASRAKGTAQVRDEKLSALLAELHQLKAYVQQVADGDPTHAEALITSAALSVKKPAARAKATFAALRGKVSGEAKLVAKAVGIRASYEWQWSLDQKTWTMAPSTLQSRTVIPGLTPGSTYAFRFRAVTKDGEGDWSAVATLVMS